MSRHEFIAVIDDFEGHISEGRDEGRILVVPERKNRVLPAEFIYEGPLADFSGLMEDGILRFRVSGDWEEGKGFELEAVANAAIPKKTLGKEELDWLASGKIPHISAFTAQKILDIFGGNSGQILIHSPAELRGICGFGKAWCLSASRAWRKVLRHPRAFREFMASGITSRSIAGIYYNYGGDWTSALEFLREDPYRGLSEGFSNSFYDCDLLAGHFGISEDSDIRYRAFLCCYVDKMAGRGGNTRMDEREFQSMLSKNTLELREDEIKWPRSRKLDVAGLRRAADSALKRGTLVKKRGFVTSFRAFREEYILAKNLRALADRLLPPLCLPEGYDLSVLYSVAGDSIKLEEGQVEALSTFLRSSIMTLTGGPGTGKTTTMCALLNLLHRVGKTDVTLLAPTGRAAKRLAETTGARAFTVHSRLGISPEGGVTGQIIDSDVLIVDEMSMLDSKIANILFSKISARTRVVLVGDPGQLPSVDAGNVFANIIDSGIVPPAYLGIVKRQGKGSLIAENAEAVRERNKGKFVLPPYGKSDADMQFLPLLTRHVWKTDPDFEEKKAQRRKEGREALVRLVKDFTDRDYDREDILCLTRVRQPGHILNVNELNILLRGIFNPDGEEVSADKRLPSGALIPGLRIGDTVVQKKNDNARNIYNGDVGVILNYDKASRRLEVNFGTKDCPFPVDIYPENSSGEFAHLEPGYALTVHKAQGSESPVVIYFSPAEHTGSKSPSNLLYTGFTRGRDLTVLVGDSYQILSMVGNGREVRSTNLLDLLKDETFMIEAESLVRKFDSRGESLQDENRELPSPF